MSDIHAGDEGTVFELTVRDDDGVIDIRGAAVTADIKYRNILTTKQGSIIDGVNGLVDVTLTSDDVKFPGNYTIKVHVTFQDGRYFSSDDIRFPVLL